MDIRNNLIFLIIENTKRFLAPIEKALFSGNIQYFQSLCRQYGIDLEEYFQDLGSLREPLGKINVAIQAIHSFDLDDNLNLKQVHQLLNTIKQAYKSIQQLSALSLPEDHVIQTDSLLENLFTGLLKDYLEDYQPKLFYLFLFSGVLSFDTRRQLQFNSEKFDSFFKDPITSLKELYSNDTEHLLFFELLAYLYKILWALGIEAYTLQVPAANHLALTADLPYNEFDIELRIPFFEIFEDEFFSEAGLSIFNKQLGDEEGSFLSLFLYGTAMMNREISLLGGWKASILGNISSQDDFGIFLTKEGIEYKNIELDTVPDLRFSLKIGKENTEELKKEVLFELLGSRLSYGGMDLSLGINFIDGQEELIFAFAFKEAAFTFDPKESDSFISYVINTPQKIKFDLSILFSTLSGLTFEGNSDLSIKLPTHVDLGPVSFEQIGIELNPDPKKLGFKLHTNARAELGPVLVSVQELGLKTNAEFLGFGASEGNLGFMDLDLGIKMPSAVSLQMKSDVVSGGGFLGVDVENHRYFGILQLQLQQIEITAIGLITTKLPNGQDGFSMLISMNVQFQPGIAVGFGFNLIGLGGLVGIHRSMEVDVLRQRVKSGAVDAILFPDDPIKDADRIIGDLRAVFPPKEDHYVLAPFLKLGWGVADPSASPPQPLLEIDLGVFIQLPFTGRAILIGSLSTQLPNKKKPQFILNIDLFGDVNFAKGYAFLLGSLRNSRIQQIKLTGDFAFFVSWKAQPQFLMSVGGYHPEYRKPPNFPSLNRIKASLSSSKNLKLFGECYFAITSNTFQTGFSVQLKAKYEGFAIQGHLSFDTFIRFKPFGLKAATQFSVAIKYAGEKLAGVRLYFVLSGPAPWIAKGTAQISFLGAELEVDFKAKWGRGTAISAPIVDPLPALRAQLQADTNWSATLPPDVQAAESLKSLEQIEEEAEQNLLLLHPAAQLSVRQQLLPFNLAISKVGGGRLQQTRSFYLENVHFGALPVEEAGIELEPVKSYFARGQFQQLDDHEKLSTRDFESLEAGLSFQGGDQHWTFGEQAEQEQAFENIIIGEDLTVQRDMTIVQQQEDEAVGEDTAKSADQSALYRQRREQQYFVPKGRRPVFQEQQQFQVVDDEFNALENIQYPSYAHAKARLDELSNKERRQWQIVAAETLVNA